MNQKDAIIFFSNEKFIIQPIEQIGLMPQKGGAFFLDSKKNQCELVMQNEKWLFSIKELNINKIKLQPLPKSDLQFELELITYPAPL